MREDLDVHNEDNDIGEKKRLFPFDRSLDVFKSMRLGNQVQLSLEYRWSEFRTIRLIFQST